MTPQLPGSPDSSDLTLSEPDRQELIGWASACVRRLLPVFSSHRSDDDRLTSALDGARQFQTGELSVGALRRLAFGCHAAARECTDPPASAVARACGQAVAVAHMGGHARNVPRYTRKALSGATLAAELDWQEQHVPERFRTYVYPTTAADQRASDKAQGTTR